jgi:hypothetical protein
MRDPTWLRPGFAIVREISLRHRSFPAAAIPEWADSFVQRLWIS